MPITLTLGYGTMIKKYVSDLAMQMGVELTKVSVIEGQEVGCLDSYLVHLFCKGQKVSLLVYKPELDNLQNDITSDRLDLKTLHALSRLKMLLEP